MGKCEARGARARRWRGAEAHAKESPVSRGSRTPPTFPQCHRWAELPNAGVSGVTPVSKPQRVGPRVVRCSGSHPSHPGGDCRQVSAATLSASWAELGTRVCERTSEVNVRDRQPEPRSSSEPARWIGRVTCGKSSCCRSRRVLRVSVPMPRGAKRRRPWTERFRYPAAPCEWASWKKKGGVVEPRLDVCLLLCTYATGYKRLHPRMTCLYPAAPYQSNVDGSLRRACPSRTSVVCRGRVVLLAIGLRVAQRGGLETC